MVAAFALVYFRGAVVVLRSYVAHCLLSRGNSRGEELLWNAACQAKYAASAGFHRADAAERHDTAWDSDLRAGAQPYTDDILRGRLGDRLCSALLLQRWWRFGSTAQCWGCWTGNRHHCCVWQRRRPYSFLRDQPAGQAYCGKSVYVS